MPIKFRCTHCNQFLGISRAQSGTVVDCPSCGRSIRVPNLDGTTAPLPKPAIDLSDSSLASALEQLASLESGGAGAETSAPAQATPTRLAAPPAVIAVPVAHPVASPSDVPTLSESTRSRQPWIEVEEQLATLSQNEAKPHTPPQIRGVSRRDVIIAASTTAVVAPLTWWLGRQARSAAVLDVAGAPDRSEPAPQPPPAPVAAGAQALTGRITYLTADGESLPDAGARILIFPEHRQGSTLLSVDGFRANAAAADLQLARESMKLYGGAFVMADDHGHYGADLTSSGAYEILMISNYQSRPAGAVPADLLKTLARYFNHPQQLIGQTAYEFTHLRFTGREPAVRDQVFQRA